MSDFMENNGQIVILFTLLLGSMLVLLTCSAVLPKPYDIVVGGTLYFVIILGGFGGGMLYTRERYNQYPHYEWKVFPSKNTISLFIDHQVNRIKDNGNNNSALIDLAFSRWFPEAQTRSRRVILNYKHDWAKRTHGGKADITINGFTVPHPNSDDMIVRYVGISLEFQEVVPVYELLMGCTDITPQYDTTSMEIPEAYDEKSLQKSMTTKELVAKLSQAFTFIKAQAYKLDEITRNASEWHTYAEAQVEIIRQQKAEIRGLLAGSASIKERALEWLLAIYAGQGSIGKTIKALRAKDTDNKDLIYKIIGAVAVVAIIFVFLWSQPQVLQNVYLTLNNPWFIVAAGIICAVIIVILFKFYRPNSPEKQHGGTKRK